MTGSLATPLGVSQIPGQPSFRSSAVNAVALVPLLSSSDPKSGDNSNQETLSDQSFSLLWQALQRHAGGQQQTSPGSVPLDTNTNKEDSLLLLVPHSSLTRPGDWRYDRGTPLKNFHWQHGCCRLRLFDGRPHASRLAHDRLLNHSLTRDWIDLVPSRRTAAVLGVLNLRDCTSLADLHRAEEELHGWAARYATPPYEVTAHGRGGQQRDTPIERLFVFDSFHESCQEIDLSQSKSMGGSILAFPPADAENAKVMELHLNVVVNDLAVAIFCSLEQKIKASDDISRGMTLTVSSSFGSGGGRLNLSRMISRESSSEEDAPVPSSSRLSVKSISEVVSPDSKLAVIQGGGGDSSSSSLSPPLTTASSPATSSSSSPAKASDASSATAAATSSSSSTVGKPPRPTGSTQTPQLLTSLDSIWDLSELSPKDLEAFRKRDVGRREKHAADLSLLAGSPMDAYERYLQAAEFCKASGGTPDPLWYAAALEGCAAAHIAMAEVGGFNVDEEYLENNFQLPEEIMALAVKDESSKSSQSTKTTSGKQTLPEVVFALCEEALNLYSRHPRLAPIHAELLLKLALYSSESAEGHLRCRWGEGPGCHRGEPDDVPRWEKTSVSQLKLGELKTKEGEDMIGFSTFNRVKKVCELLQEAVMLGSLDQASRIDVAARSAQMCLDGVMATRWKKVDYERIELPRKAAFFAVIAADAVSSAEEGGGMARNLWLLSSQLYSSKANTYDRKNYGWATLRASVLHALSMHGNDSVSLEAAERLLSLLGEISPDKSKDIVVDEKAQKRKSAKLEHEDLSESGKSKVSQRTERSAVESSTETVSATASTFASKIKHSFTTMTASSSLLVVQSKWSDDEPIQPVVVPLAEPSQVADNTLALNCVWTHVGLKQCCSAQKTCINRILSLRRALPYSSVEEKASLINGENPIGLPIYVSSAMAIQVESTLELECVKARGSAGSDKDQQGAMATFYNPFDNKEKDKVSVTRVAEGEERAFLIQFGNHLSLPFEVRRCELAFENNEAGRVRGTGLSFVVPPKATGFTVHFPFTVRACQDDSIPKADSSAFEVKGITLTCMGRTLFLPIRSSGGKAAPGTGSLPEPLTGHRSVPTEENDDSAQEKPQVQAFPCQPRLRVFVTASGAPLEPESVVSVNLSDGEIFTLPSFSLENYPGPSGRGKIERLQITVNGIVSGPDRVLYDSDLSSESEKKESEDDFVRELSDAGKSVPLKIRALASSLKLGTINETSASTSDGRVFQLQAAAANNMRAQLPKGTTARLRFRYRGVSHDDNEVWRNLDISLRIVPSKGPRITALEFRPDLSKNSAYSELCTAYFSSKSVKKEEDIKEQVANLPESPDESIIVKRVGIDSGVYVCSHELVFILTVANETSSVITLSRPEGGAVGGFDVSPLETVVVHPGVSAKVPVVMSRFRRLDDSGSPSDLISNLVAKTELRWDAERVTQAGQVIAKGRIHIPTACAKDIMARYPSFVSEICEPPVRLELTVGGKRPDGSPLHTSLGVPVDVSVSALLSPWLPEDVASCCNVRLEFCCARQSLTSHDGQSNTRDFVWCGKVRQKFALNDEEKTHKARLAFVQVGTYFVSACARISRSSGGSGSGSKDAEIWWAPVAASIAVDGKLPAQ